MEIINAEHIRLRVYERGAGETQACGSGACAAVAVGITQGLLAKRVRVDLPGGSLNITWEDLGAPLYMTEASNSCLRWGHPAIKVTQR